MSGGPNCTGKKQAEQAAREARLAKALRDNLRRRKEQGRARKAVDGLCRRKGPGGLSGAPLSSKSNRHGGKD